METGYLTYSVLFSPPLCFHFTDKNMERQNGTSPEYSCIPTASFSKGRTQRDEGTCFGHVANTVTRPVLLTLAQVVLY